MSFLANLSEFIFSVLGIVVFVIMVGTFLLFFITD